MTYPIPSDALDDRLGIVGTSGAGKTYTAMGAVERLLASGARCVIVDPLDVWWGLRLSADGERASKFNLPILGGSHGDLPLTENSGALIGETVSGMADSCIVSLGGFSSGAAERRFMLAFLNALYRRSSGSLFHLVLDEADLWAPQQVLDKDGGTMQLKGVVESIVRRGRVKGFIPWLITQRPAVIDKSVMSMMVGLVAMKAMSPQDRSAIMDWLKGQMTAEQRAELDSAMPNLNIGEGVVWIPGHNVLHRAQFPVKATFDSSRAPKRGEAVAARDLKPLDLGVLQERLSTVEAEVKANDPKTLKAEVARLRAEAAKAPVGPTAPAGPTPAQVEAIRREAFLEGVAEGERRGNPAGQALMLTRVRLALDALKVDQAPAAPQKPAEAPRAPAPPVQRREAVTAPAPRLAAAAAASPADGEVSAPIRKVLSAVAWWNAFGLAHPSANQVGFIAGYSPTGGTFKRYRGEARTTGLLTYPSDGRLALTEAGAELAERPDSPPTVAGLHDAVRTNLDAPLVKLLNPLLRAYPEALSVELVGEEAGYEASGGTFKRYRGQLKTLEIIDYPGPGLLRAADWLFPGA